MRHNCAYTRGRVVMMMMVFQALERGINTCKSFCTTSIVWYDQLKHIAEGRQRVKER
jgi:hypothetical protein